MIKLGRIFIGVFVFVLLWTSPVYAQSGLDCNASVAPSSVQPSSTATLNFNVTNTGAPDILWVWIGQQAEEVFTVQAGSASGWSILEQSTGMVLFGGGTITYGGSTSFAINITTPATAGVVSDWKIMTSNYAGGNETVYCSGSSQVSVDAVTGATTPVISNLTVSVGSSSTTMSWQTNVETTGIVNYGTTDGYGSSTTTASGTSHSATISNLSSSTTYHYKIQVTGTGGTTSTTDATFTTSAANVNTTTTTTVTNTVTETAVVTKTVILADTAKPAVSVTTKLAKAYAEAPIIEGKVVDTGAVNVGVAKIQYSTDNGISWLLVDEPSGASKVDFSFVPEVYEDGNYQIIVRATDQSGNIGVSPAQTLIIDRLPPRIIHSLWRVGPIILTAPYELIVGVPVQVTLQAVGGVTEMELRIGAEKFNMIKNFETGLWEGDVVVNSVTNVPIIVRAIDGGGNEIVQEIGDIKVGESSSAFASETVTTTVYRLDELTKRYKPWNGEVYGQDNPSANKSSWYLPPGKYYVEAKGRGYKTAETSIFNLGNFGVVGVSGKMEKWNILRFWEVGTLGISHSRSVGAFHSGSVIAGNQILWLDKTIYRGKEIRLVVVPIWEPRLAGILSGLSEGDVVVLPGSNKSSVDLLKTRGSYKMDLVADPDGEILSDLKGVSLPINLMINRRGQVQ